MHFFSKTRGAIEMLLLTLYSFIPPVPGLPLSPADFNFGIPPAKSPPSAIGDAPIPPLLPPPPPPPPTFPLLLLGLGLS